ncbi:MAG: DUF86 domain-containing protein [candidate division NC10 bacterium]|nr:DUF86 domain-containing protein [candidate division NC10 bacterium]
MSPRDWRIRLQDIVEAIRNTQGYIEGMTYEAFAADLKTVRATAYDIGIIGEAASRIPDEVRSRYPHVPWDKMQAIRNVIVHEYFRLDVAILWQTITQNLPPLLPMLEEILQREE